MEQVTEKTHAVLGPSGASRWMSCPGSVVLEKPYPHSTSIYAAWGTVAHEVADLCLQDSLLEEAYPEPLDAERFVGRTFSVDGFSIEVDMEMADCVNTYTSHVHSYLDLQAGDTLLAEQEVSIEHLTGEQGATGTSDVIGFAGKDELVVIDLKGGQGVLVEAEDNMQLAMYALGSYEAHKDKYAFKTVRMVIVQPRKNHVSEWCITIDQLVALGEDVKDAARLVDEAVETAPTKPPAKWNTAYLEPSESACRWCKAKATCPALRGAVFDTLTAGASSADDFADLDAEPEATPKVLAAAIPSTETLENDQLAAAMRSAKLVESWLTAVRAETERRLFDGQDISGFGLFVGRQGNRRWSDVNAVEEALKASRVKREIMYSTSVISPTQAEKALKDTKPKVWRRLEEEFIVRTEGKPHVAPLSEGGEPYTAHIAQAEDFDDLGEANDPLLD